MLVPACQVSMFFVPQDSDLNSHGIKESLLLLRFIYLFDREPANVHKQGEPQGEGEAGPPQSRESDAGLYPRDHDLIRRQMLNRLSHPDIPGVSNF